MPSGLVRSPTFAHSHVAQFYTSDDELARRAADYLSETRQAGDTAIAVATAAHRMAILDRLTEHEPVVAASVDAAARADAGSLVILDAGETLERILVGGKPARGPFREVIGGLVAEAIAGGRPCYVYGEMVDLLWATGHVDAVLVGELVGNAVAHVGSPPTVTLVTTPDTPDTVRISVLDSGQAGSGGTAPFVAARGRGLGTVASLARDWGNEGRDDGMLVWAELARRAPRAGSS